MTDRPSDPDLHRPEGEIDSADDLSEADARALEIALRGGPDGGALAAHDRAWAKALAGADALEPELEPSEEERDHVARGEPLALFEALRAAHAPALLAPTRHETLLRRTVHRAPRRGRWALVGGAALAAAVLLALRVSPEVEPRATTASDVELSRSTESLVASAAAARASVRVDRVAQARGGDYRHNRFRRWGVK